MAENKDKKVLNVPNKREITPNQFDTAEHKEVRLKRNVPNLRFKEFEGEWKENYVNEICNEFKSGKTIKADLILDVGVYPVFGGNGLRGYTSTYNHDGLFVLIGRQGALCGNVRSVIGKTYITEHAIAVNGNDKSDTNFLHYLFLQMDLGRFSDQSAQPGLAVNKLLKLKVITPRIDEQRKIANFLRLLDERIATQNKIIDKLESLIKGTCNYSINKISRQGAYKKLGEICHITTGKLDANAMVNDGKFPFFTCAASPFKIDKYAFDTEALLISGNGANLGYINYYNGRFNAYQRTYVLDSFIENIQYIKFALKATLPKRIEIEKSTSNTPYIVLSTLSEMKLPTPNKTIQNNVAGLMLSLENKLHFQVRLLEAYNQQKQYLLRQMFI